MDYPNSSTASSFLGESDIPERQAKSIYVTGFKPE
jgi:hypothetical protein